MNARALVRRRWVRIALVAGVLVWVVMLLRTGPTHPHTIAVEVHTRQGLPGLPCVPTVREAETGCIAAAIRPGHRLALMLFGSGSCPRVPTELSVLGPSRIRMSSSDDYEDTICTTDFAPTVSIVVLPAQVDTTRPLTVEVVLPSGPLDTWHGERHATVVAAPPV